MTAKADTTATYNLKAVVQETGLRPDTLRAWERRYGLPQPERTSGHHRLYSQHDIEVLKWLVARQDEGLTISRAVDLWHKFIEDGQDPLVAMPAASPFPSAPQAVVTGDALTELRQRWLSACLQFDEAGAEAALSQAFALFPPETVFLELVRPGLVEIGNGWHAGQITVQQEHFTSTLAMRRLESVSAAAPPPTRSGRILVACPPDEVHTFSPLLIAFLLKRQGWRTIYLGASVPLERFQNTLAQIQPQLVVLAAQQLHTAATLLDMARMVHADGSSASAGMSVAFGGSVFAAQSTLHTHIPGYYLGNRLDQAVQTVEKIMTARPPLPRRPPLPAGYAEALAHFLQVQSQLRTTIREMTGAAAIGLPDSLLIAVDNYLVQDITAALKLGDMNLLDSNITWVRSLVAHRDLPEQLVHAYLKAFLQASAVHLNERGAPILAWLENVVYHISTKQWNTG